MKINIYEVRKQIKTRALKTFIKGQSIGSALKYQRKLLGLTLEETSENICSLSYLCKVENNQIIPSELYLKSLKERLKIDEDLEEKIHEPEIYEVMNCLMFDQKLDQTFYQKYQKAFDYHAVLMKVCFHLTHHDYHQLNMMIPTMIHQMDAMPEVYMYVALLLTSESMYLEMQHIDAIKLLYGYYKVYQKSDTILVLMEKAILKHAYKCHHHLMISKVYPIYLNHLEAHHLFEPFESIKFDHLVYESKMSNLYELKEDLEIKHFIKSDKKDYMLMIKLCYEKQFKDAYLLALKHKDLNVDWQIAYAFLLDQTQQILKLKAWLDEQKSNHRPSIRLVSSYLSQKYNQDKAFEIYLKDEMIPNKGLTDNYDILNYFLLDGLQFLQNNHFYKDATLMQKNYRYKMEFKYNL